MELYKKGVSIVSSTEISKDGGVSAPKTRVESEDVGSTENESAEQLNRAYFQSLIATRSSLGMLGVAWAGIFLGVIAMAIFWGTGLDYNRDEPFQPFTLIALTGTLFMVVSEIVIVVNPLRRFFYRHQKFSSLWQVIFVFDFMLLLVLLMTLMFFSGLNRGMNTDIYASPFLFPYMCAISLIYLVTILYNCYWLRNQLKKGMSRERAKKNYQAKSAVMHPVSLGIIFAGTIVGALILSQDGHYELAFGAAGNLLFLSAFSRLHVEYAYSAVLKWKDSSYWEEHRPNYDIHVSKTALRISIEIVLLVIIFYYIGVNDLQGEQIGWLHIPVFLFLADWIIVGIRKVCQKRKNNQED